MYHSKEMEPSNALILASGSPRRQELMKALGIQFSVKVRDVDEQFPEELKDAEVALYLAGKKASAYTEEIALGHTVITADTIVCIDHFILNKPSGHEEAFEMLKKLSGRSHEVITGVCIKNKTVSRSFHVTTKVIFRELSDNEINYYINNFKPFDKAGAYGIQEWIGLVGLERLEGSYYNVVGLPVKELYEELISLNLVRHI